MESSYRLLNNREFPKDNTFTHVTASKTRRLLVFLIIVNILLVASVATLLFRDPRKLNEVDQPLNFSKSRASNSFLAPWDITDSPYQLKLKNYRLYTGHSHGGPSTVAATTAKSMLCGTLFCLLMDSSPWKTPGQGSTTGQIPCGCQATKVKASIYSRHIINSTALCVKLALTNFHYSIDVLINAENHSSDVLGGSPPRELHLQPSSCGPLF